MKAFYLVGALTLVWYCFWLLLVFDSPSQHPRISAGERGRIEAALAKESEGRGGGGGDEMPVPWRDIFTSKPFYGLLVSDSKIFFCSRLLNVASSYRPPTCATAGACTRWPPTDRPTSSSCWGWTWPPRGELKKNDNSLADFDFFPHFPASSPPCPSWPATPGAS